MGATRRSLSILGVGMDFSSILANLSWADVVAAILAGGAVIAMVLWTIVVVRQVATFFHH